MAKKTITVERIGSPIRETERQRATLKGLGLRRASQRRTLEDTPAIRGMVNSIPHLVRIVD